MRLLKPEANGEFSLTNDITHPTTPYAILSHTWGEDNEEVTFEDLKDGSGKTKTGYKKLRFCGQQAVRDGLQYFWVDTCCINKSRDAELSEAINSMFRWYRKAAICYVYLADVWSKDQINLSSKPWEAAFRNSRWFTRGWTLQELIAPPLVEFFSLNGNRLGDKKSLEAQLHRITGIPVLALRGGPLSDFCFDERVSWARHRDTKREEDLAYSLLGILDISIPVIYGEGRENAFRRLNREWKYRLDELLKATPNHAATSEASPALPAAWPKMGFLGVYRAIYDYTPRDDSELAIKEADILFVLEKSEGDGWWKAKKMVSGEDDDEPVGLIPSNYIEKVCCTQKVIS